MVEFTIPVDAQVIEELGKERVETFVQQFVERSIQQLANHEQKVVVKVQLDEEMVQAFGKDKMEVYVEQFVQQAILKLCAEEIGEDLARLDEELENDPEWQAVRQSVKAEKKRKRAINL